MAKTPKSVETITHEGDTRTNIPTAEYENLMRDEDKKPIEHYDIDITYTGSFDVVLEKDS